MRAFAFACALLVFLIPVAARAYLPPAGFVMNHAVGMRAGLKSIEWTAKLTRRGMPEAGTEGGGSGFQETLRVEYTTGKVQISFRSPTDQPLGAIQTTLAKLSPLGRFWLVVALDPNLTRVRSALEGLEILPASGQEVRLSRVEGKTAWSWGGAGDPVSEVDIEKDEFTPLGYRSGRGAGGMVVRSVAFAGASAKVPKHVSVQPAGRTDGFDFELKSVKTDGVPEKKFVESAVTLPVIKEWIQLVR